MDVETRTTRATAAEAVEIAGALPVGRLATAVAAGAGAVPGTALAAALDEAGDELAAGLRLLGRETEEWSQDVAAAMGAYEAADAEAADGLRRLAGTPRGAGATS